MSRKTRPSKLDKEMIAKVSDLVRKKITYRAVCALAGISERVFLEWRQKGKEAVEQGIDNLYAQLYLAVEQAEAEVEKEVLERAIEDAQGARWFLTRRFRQAYSDRVELDVSGSLTYKVTFDDSVGFDDAE